MRIELLDNFYEADNNKEAVDKLFDEVSSLQENGQYILDYIEIDGNKVHGNYYDVLIDNIAFIKEVKVVMVSANDYLREIMVSIKKYIENAVKEISSLADGFYRGTDNDTWIKFQQFIEGIEWINSGAAIVAKNAKALSEADKYVKTVSEILNKLPELEEAINNSDYVLIGDLLNYEIIPVLETIKDAAEDMINGGVDKDVFN
jgi:hypothetical protein